jgi:hypothetical protein
MELNVSTCFTVEDFHKIIGVAVRCLGRLRVLSPVSFYRLFKNRIFPNGRAVERSLTKLGVLA